MIIVNPEHKGHRISVHLLPNDQWLALPWKKTAAQLLHALDLEEETALVARGRELLTPDRHIWPGEEIMVRIVTSRG